VIAVIAQPLAEHRCPGRLILNAIKLLYSIFRNSRSSAYFKVTTLALSRSTPSAETSFEKDEPALSFAPAELVLGRPMLTRILTEIEGKGIQFILPRCDESSEEILLPFKTLLDKGFYSY
jgi:hypothetical protein